MNHTLGSGERRFGRFRIRYGAAIREYYQVRDGLYLINKKYTPFKNKIRFMLGFIVRLLLHPRVLNNGEQRRMYIKRGWKDHFKKITGEYR